MNKFTFALMYAITLLSVVNAALTFSPSGQLGWVSSAVGWGMAAYLIYRREFA